MEAAACRVFRCCRAEGLLLAGAVMEEGLHCRCEVCKLLDNIKTRRPRFKRTRSSGC